MNDNFNLTYQALKDTRTIDDLINSAMEWIEIQLAWIEFLENEKKEN